MAIEVFKLFGSIMVKNDEANKNISKTEEKAEGLGKKLIGGIGTAAKWGAAIAAAAGTAAIGLGTVAVKSSDQFQKSLNQLQAATGATNEQIKDLGNVVKGVYGNNFGESFEDVANAVEVVNKNLGLQGQELQNITELAIGFGDTFGAEIGESTRSAKTLMQQFGISAEEAYNLMTQGQQQGLDYSGELLDSINEYSVHFKQIGLDAEDMFNVFLDGSASGAFNLDKVGDAVKELGIKVKEGSANEALTKLGFSADEVVSKFNKGGEEAKEAFYGIFEALGKVDDQTKLNTLGTELMGTMFEDLGKDAVIALGEMSDGFNRTIDSAKEVNSIKYNSFGEALKGIKRQVETNVLIPIGDLILPTLNKFANWFAGEGQEYLKSFSAAVMSIMPGVQLVFTTVFDTITGAIEILKAIFLTNIDGMTFSWEGLMQGIQTFWQDYGKPIFDAFVSIFKTVYDNVEPILSGLQQLWGLLMSYYSTMWESIGKPVFDFFIDILNKLVEVFNYVFPIISNTFGGMCETINNLWVSILQPVLQAIGAFLQAILLPIFSSAFNNIANSVMTAFNFIGSLWNNILKPILDGIINFIGGIFSGNWSQIWTGIIQMLSGIWGAIKMIIWSPIEAAINKISGAVDAIISPFRQAANAIGNIWSGIKSVFKLPHFTFSGSMNPLNWLDEGLPKIGVEWYAKGGVMHQPTVFGMNGSNAMVGGEAGPEAVAPIETLMDYIRTAVAEGMGNNGVDYNRLFSIIVEAFMQAIIATGMNKMDFYVDKERFGQAMAETYDKIDGQRMKLAERGLILK